MAIEHPKFCPHCGAGVIGATKFCTSCGKSVVGEAPAIPASGALPTKKKSPTWAYVLITLVALWLAWSQVVAPAMRQVEATKVYMISYRIGGTARTVDLTYNNAGGDTEQQNDKSVPWNSGFSAHPGQFLYVSAQNQGESGTVTCEITLNGAVVKSSQSSGAYSIATCSGKV